MPAQTKPISREYRIYLALWRKAFLNPDEEVVVKVSTFSMACAMRQGMYRAIRPFRNGQLSDEELRQATDKYVIYLDRDEAPLDQPHTLYFRNRKALSELETMLTDLGLDEEDLLLGEERVIMSTLSEFIQKSEDEDSPKRTTTPFYSRED